MKASRTHITILVLFSFFNPHVTRSQHYISQMSKALNDVKKITDFSSFMYTFPTFSLLRFNVLHKIYQRLNHYRFKSVVSENDDKSWSRIKNRRTHSHFVQLGFSATYLFPASRSVVRKEYAHWPMCIDTSKSSFLQTVSFSILHKRSLIAFFFQRTFHVTHQSLVVVAHRFLVLNGEQHYFLVVHNLCVWPFVLDLSMN